MMPLVIGTLIFIAVVAVGSAVVGLLSGSPATVKKRLEKNRPAALRPNKGKEDRSPLHQLLGKIGEGVLSSVNSRVLTKKLAQAGYYNRAAPAIYFGSKMLLLVGSGVVCFVLLWPTSMDFSTTIFIALATAGTCFLLPNLIVERRRKKRSQEIQRHLPDVVDLMEICVTSGMGFETAWNLISDEIRELTPVIADEMTLTNLEVHLGASRKEAMQHMAERTGAEQIDSFATLVAQSQQFGTSIGDTLRVFAESMREERSQQAEEKGEKMAVKLIIPMVLFVFPAVAVILAGPGIIRIASALGKAAQ